MGRLYTSMWEWGVGDGADFEELQSAAKNFSVVRRAGSTSRECEINENVRWQIGPGVPPVEGRYYTCRFYFYLTALHPTAEVSSDSAPTNSLPSIATFGPLDLRIDKLGRLFCVNSFPFGSVDDDSPSAPITTGTWHMAEIAYRLQEMGTRKGYLSAKLNGNQFVERSCVALNSRTNAIQIGLDSARGWSAGTKLYVQDVAVNDDQGANQNKWIGPGAVHLLKPISDTTKADWENGTSHRANSLTKDMLIPLFECLNNVPPLGGSNDYGEDPSIGGSGATYRQSEMIAQNPDLWVGGTVQLGLESVPAGAVALAIPHIAAGLGPKTVTGSSPPPVATNMTAWSTGSEPAAKTVTNRIINASFGFGDAVLYQWLEYASPTSLKFGRRSLGSTNTVVNIHAAGVYVEVGAVAQPGMPDPAQLCKVHLMSWS